MFPEHSFNHWTIIRQNMALNRLEEKISKIEQNTMNNNEWKPIDTAPNDGTWVLAIEEHSTKPFIANFRKEKAGDIIFEHWYSDNNYVCFPIFWMPLPNPPTK